MKSRTDTGLCQSADTARQRLVGVMVMGLLIAMMALSAGCAPTMSKRGEDSIVKPPEISPENQPPSAQAGPDQTVQEGRSVTLRGSGTDADGRIGAYRWDQVAGSPVSISDQSDATVSFAAPKVEESAALKFRLTVTDEAGATATDEVVVTIAQYGRLEAALTGKVKNHSTYAGIPRASISVRQYAEGVSRIVGVADTNATGEYSVWVRANPGRLTVKATAAGFAPQSAVVDWAKGVRASADLGMVAVQVSQPFEPGSDAEVRIDGQTVVSLSGESLVTVRGGVASGEATARVTVLDASRDPSVMPGAFERWNAEDADVEPIESFGAINVMLSEANGERLNLGRGKQARISIPLASGRRPEDSPASIPLFYWSDATGYWVEEGTAVLEETAAGRWAYTGSVGHFSTWNADAAYESIELKGCVNDEGGKPVANAEVTARGTDYVGDSKATTSTDGRFEISVRPDSKLELVAVAEGPLYSEATSISTKGIAMELAKCLVVTGDQSLRDFPMKIKGKKGSLEICVRDHECEDGDQISVDVESRNVFSGELVNERACTTLEVEDGGRYVVEMTALNGTGYKGDCDHSDVNTGEIRVSGENIETQVWRHRGGTGSKAHIVVEGIIPTEKGPEMVEIPGGSFRMGCVSGQDCYDDEHPVHTVRVERFELSKYEVTFEEYDRFTAATGRDRAGDRGWGRGRRPVINVSWDDAVAYARWLSEQTGERYRLPSEAEWEYAARAGSVTKYSWGNEIGRNRANCNECGRRWDDQQTAPVGSFAPNGWGLHDMHGNVAEWVQDCWNENYQGAPTDGSAWESGDCDWRVLRGGSSYVYPRFLRSANRYRSLAMYWSNDREGFRVARTVAP